MPTLSDLYTQNPGAVPTPVTPPAQVGPTPELAQATASNANSTGYNAQTQSVPTSELASSQLNSITSQDSPLMKQARQEGILAAAKRGLQNSSIAGGNSEAAMVEKATPLALANAQALQTQSLANQQSTNQASEFGANAQNDVSKLNAQLQTATAQGNAQEANALRTRITELQTQTNMQGADIQARANELTSSQENDMRLATLNQNAQLNQQYLTGTQQMDLEQIRGQFQTLISSNDAAANLYQAYFNSIAMAMQNTNLKPERAAQIVAQQQTQLTEGLKLIDAMNTINAPGGPTGVPTGVAPPMRIPSIPTGPARI